MRFVFLVCLWVGTVGALSLARAVEFVVIVHQENPARTMERDDLSRIFLKRTVKWPHGVPVEPVDLPPTAKARAAFTRMVHGKSVNAVRAFWQQQIFSGRDVPPPEKSSDADVIEFVRTNPGAVGYVSSTTPLLAGVKTIALQGH